MGQGLNYKAAARQHMAVVGVDPDTKVYHGGLLFADGEILGKVLGYLAGNYIALAHVGLLHAKVAHNGKVAKPTHRHGNVQLAVGTQWQLQIRHLDISLYMSLIIRRTDDIARGAAALYYGGQLMVLSLELGAHHIRHQQCPAQGRSAYPGKAVKFPCLFTYAFA